DRFGRVREQRWLKSGTALERVQYTFDLNGNRVTRANLVAEALSADQDEWYSYNNLNELTARYRGTLPSSSVWDESFSLDPTGNWNHYANTDLGTQDRTHRP